MHILGWFDFLFNSMLFNAKLTFVKRTAVILFNQLLGMDMVISGICELIQNVERQIIRFNFSSIIFWPSRLRL